MPKSLVRLREVAYKVPKGTKPIALTCGHTALYLPPLPTPGTDAFCRECNGWSRRKRTDVEGAEPVAMPLSARPPRPFTRKILLRILAGPLARYMARGLH